MHIKHVCRVKSIVSAVPDRQRTTIINIVIIVKNYCSSLTSTFMYHVLEKCCQGIYKSLVDPSALRTHMKTNHYSSTATIRHRFFKFRKFLGKFLWKHMKIVCFSSLTAVSYVYQNCPSLIGPTKSISKDYKSDVCLTNTH